MERLLKKTVKSNYPPKENYADRIWSESWTYIKTVVDTTEEPFLILDKNLYVVAANQSFYRMFQVELKDTENKLVYELGNGQWDIPQLRKLLEDILPNNSFFKGFEVTHNFPLIGRKVMILNARRIYKEGNNSTTFPPIILFVMEDVTEMMDVAKILARRKELFELEMTQKTDKLEIHIKELEKELGKLHSTVSK